MQIPDKSIREFVEAYKDEFGEELGYDEAQEMASHVLALYEALVRRLPSEVLGDDINENDGGESKIGFRT